MPRRDASGRWGRGRRKGEKIGASRRRKWGRGDPALGVTKKSEKIFELAIDNYMEIWYYTHAEVSKH
jgi:hypothetical protein